MKNKIQCWFSPKWIQNLMLHKKTQTGFYDTFTIYTCSNLSVLNTE